MTCVPNAALLDLAERCEQAAAGNRQLDQLILDSLDGNPVIPLYELNNQSLIVRRMPGAHSTNDYYLPPYTYSLDAAMSLVPNEWRFAGSETMRGDFYAHLITRELTDQGAKAHTEATADTLTLALCAAALKARAAQGTQRAETENTGSVHDGPVPEGNAP